MFPKTSFAVLLVSVIGLPLCFAELLPCDYSGWAPQLQRVEQESPGYHLRYDLNHGRSPDRGFIFKGVENLASEMGVTPVFINAWPGERAVPGTTWSGDKPEAALEGFLASAGFEIHRHDDLLLVARNERLEKTKVIIVVYSIGGWDGKDSEEKQSTARQLLRKLPVRYWGENRLPLRWLALGCYPVPDEDDVYLVIATLGDERISSLGSVFKVKMADVNAEVECLWRAQAIGQLVPEIQEDFDRDGVRDYVLKSPPNLTTAKPDVILSGHNGRTIVEFSTGSIVVEEHPSGIERVSVAHAWPLRDHDESFVLDFEPETNTFTVDANEGPPEPPATSRTRKNRESRLGVDNVAALVRAGAEPASLHAYVLPDFELNSRGKAVRVTKSASSEVWNQLINAARIAWVPFDQADFAEIAYLYRYDPPETAEEDYFDED